ncbi:hypothetical protein ACTFJW_17760 [Clostridium cagae]|uniref:hypothetical protein n=1 Tax=Clostridium cagae TaxID=2080751 RepID=UPI003F7744A7
MSILDKILFFILLLLIISEIVYIILIPYNINSIAASLKEIAKSLKDKNGGE